MASNENEDNLKKIKSIKNAIDAPHFDILGAENIKVSIRPNTKVSLGSFKPDPFIPAGYLAHPTTIRAMKKDIFALGEEVFSDLEKLYQCQSCQTKLDLQFWYFCPYCEASFPKDTAKC